MRRGLDWYKRDPIAFIDGVQGMGPECIGAFAVLLDLIYARGGETLRDDRHLAGVLGCSIQKARKLTDALLEAGKLGENGGMLSNDRARETAKVRQKLSKTRAKVGRKGGSFRQVFDIARNENNDLAQAKTPDIEEEKEKNRVTDVTLSNAREARSMRRPREPGRFEDWWKLVPRKVGKGAARRAYAKALTLTDEATLFSAISRYAELRKVQDERYTVHPATWLNQERWTDEIPLSNFQPPQIRSTPNDAAEIARQAAAEFRSRMDCGPGPNSSGPLLRTIAGRGLN